MKTVQKKLQKNNRNRNMTIENMSAMGLRSQSPNMFSPMIKNNKFETNNHIINGM